ncbi:MAG: hypothetical protein U0231_07405 [Nitrospiraceae bacterium]
MGDTLAGNRILEGLHHMRLPDNVIEGAGPVFAGGDLVIHAASTVHREA